MAQLKDTVIEGVLKIQGKDSEGKALILPEESEIYIGNEPFKGGVSSEEIQQMGFVTNSKIGGEELGLVKDGGDVTINADGTMTVPECAFVAEYDVTTFDEIQNAYNEKKIVFCTHGWLVTKLDILAPDRYAQFSGLDDIGNPALLEVTKNNVWTRTNVMHATTDFVNQKVGSLETYVNKKIPYLVTYNITSYDEVKSAYDAGNELILYDPSDASNHTGIYANLTSYDGRRFEFTYLDFTDVGRGSLQRSFQVSLDQNNETSWVYFDNGLARSEYVEIIDDNYKNFASTTNVTLYKHDKKISSLLDSAYNFRGGFCNNAGTLHIKNPGIYLVLAGGRENKTITINYPNGKKEFEATDWSGIILLAYESGVVTPIGVKSSVFSVDAFQLPGTFQGWTSDGTYSTTINYPSMCVVSYLGNSNVDYLS